MSQPRATVDSVVRQQLCCGCGACAFVSPELYQIEDREEEGRRPVRQPIASAASIREAERNAYEVCPGAALSHSYDADDAALDQSLLAGWGPVRRIWEGHATDEEIRFRGSSGGAITGLALFGLERQQAAGVLHITAREDDPIYNETVLSRDRAELLRAAGSRYSPASPCERLDLIENAPGPCIFIGKPCDVAALNNVCRLRPELREKVALTIALFCAGTPSTAGTKAILKRMQLDADAPLDSFRYRGHGWPGRATAITKGGQSRSLTYDEAWGEILTKHVQWRCRLCIDHTGEFADIAVGDPWYRTPSGREHGDSLILARTERGERHVRAAIESGYLRAELRGPEILPASQPNLLKARGTVWGRVMACRLIGAGAPRYERLPTFRFWLSHLTMMERWKSIVGTIRRVLDRRYLPQLKGWLRTSAAPHRRHTPSAPPPEVRTPVSSLHDES